MMIPYLILGITGEATDAEIRSRYLALVKKFPPETSPEKFQQITEAYEAVRTRRKRIEVQLFGLDADSGRYAEQLALVADSVEVRRRRVGLQELFEMEKQCSKK